MQGPILTPVLILKISIKLTDIFITPRLRGHAKQMKYHRMKYFGVKDGKTAENNRKNSNSFDGGHFAFRNALSLWILQIKYFVRNKS